MIEAMMITSLIVSIPPPKTQVTDRFLTALAMVEYGGKGQAPDGDNGLAVGPFQIHRIYRRQANICLRGPVFNDDDRNSFRASKEMARVVLKHFEKYHRDRGIKITPAVLCSFHRLPSIHWKPERMNSVLERGRTKRLLAYMKGVK